MLCWRRFKTSDWDHKPMRELFAEVINHFLIRLHTIQTSLCNQWDGLQVFRPFCISWLACIQWFKRWRMADMCSSCCDVTTSHIFSRSQPELLNTFTVIQTILWCNITYLCPKFKFKMEVMAPVDQLFCSWALVWSADVFQSYEEHIYRVHVIAAGVMCRDGDWGGKRRYWICEWIFALAGACSFFLFFSPK